MPTLRRPRFKPFQPYQPPLPPAGSYDPALDAQRAASQRGLLDLRQDLETGGTRDLTDYGLRVEDINRQAGQSGTDLATAQQRADADHARNIELLTRRYQQLGDRQTEQGNAYGVLNGGAMLQAAAKRAENKSIDQQPIDTSYLRFTGDNQQAQQRLIDSQQRQLGLAGLGLNRGMETRDTQLRRAQREDVAFGLDIGAQQAYQAAGANYVPPQRGEPGGQPSNEFGTGTTAHRIITRGNTVYVVDPTGKVISTRARRR